MTRPLAALALLALPAVASAQVGTPPPSEPSVFVGPPMLGGRVVGIPPIAGGGSALFPVPIAVPPRWSVGGGSVSAPPQVWFPSGPWGGVNYPWPRREVIELEPEPVARVRPTLVGVPITPSVRPEATLVLQFPAAAEVWLGGKKSDGDPAAEWTLTSPALAAGEAYTFEVKGRWTIGGKTFETSRSVAVPVGDRSRWTVVSGTEFKK